MNNKGRFIISLDFELFWGLAGWTEKQMYAYQPRIEGAVNALTQILETLKGHHIKCSIGYVSGIQYGNVEDYLKAAPSLKPTYDKDLFSSYGLLMSLVKEERIDSRLLFRPDCIERLKSDSFVELASHTYSHYYALEKGQTIEQFKADIKSAKSEAEKRGIYLSSIIFPRNQIPQEYHKVCAELGFTHIRGNEESFLYRSETTPSIFDYKRVLRLVDSYFNLTGHHTYKSPVKKELVDVTASRFLRPYSKTLRFLEPLKIRRIKKDMLYAAQHGEIYHLWWHPHNFGINTKESIEQLNQICEWYVELKNKYGMESCFMKDIN